MLVKKKNEFNTICILNNTNGRFMLEFKKKQYKIL